MTTTTNPLSPDELVLKVARAISEAGYNIGPLEAEHCARAAIAAMPDLGELQQRVKQLEEGLRKIAKPGVGAAFDWSVEECERYWAQQTERCRSLARTALSHDGGGV